LGFSGPFVEAGWKPSAEAWRKIGDRLQRAYRLQLDYAPDPHDFMLILNDGVVRTSSSNGRESFCFEIGLWILNAVAAHIDVNVAERDAGEAGMRTVVTAGEHANYGIPEVRLDDLMLDATRESQGVSPWAQRAGNPVVVTNPRALQMNTAFSTAYILERGGKRYGLAGSGFFIDRSFFALIAAGAAAHPDRFRYDESPCEGGRLLSVQNLKGDPKFAWHMGFFVGTPIPIKDEQAIETEVYRLHRFFPYNEPPSEYWFDLDTFGFNSGDGRPRQI
jgi:hypothetical protein